MKFVITAAVALFALMNAASAQVQPSAQTFTIQLSADKLDVLGAALLDSIRLSVSQNPEADVSAKQGLLKDIRAQYHEQTNRKPAEPAASAANATNAELPSAEKPSAEKPSE